MSTPTPHEVSSMMRVHYVTRGEEHNWNTFADTIDYIEKQGRDLVLFRTKMEVVTIEVSQLLFIEIQ